MKKRRGFHKERKESPGVLNERNSVRKKLSPSLDGDFKEKRKLSPSFGGDFDRRNELQSRREKAKFRRGVSSTVKRKTEKRKIKRFVYCDESIYENSYLKSWQGKSAWSSDEEEGQTADDEENGLTEDEEEYDEKENGVVQPIENEMYNGEASGYHE